MKTMTKNMQNCIDACLACYEECRRTLGHCLEKGGKHANPEHAQLLLNCADICQTSANFLLAGSELHAVTCGTCAEVCDACAKSCDQTGSDAQMQKCAEACRTCAETCREMSK